MKVYRIRVKKELLNDFELESMKKRDETDLFVSPTYDTLKGAKSALNNTNAYLHHKKERYEIVEYEMTELRVI